MMQFCAASLRLTFGIGASWTDRARLGLALCLCCFLLSIQKIFAYLVVKSESRCPVRSVANYWVWGWFCIGVHCLAFLLGVCYWHFVKQVPGALYRRFFLYWQASYGAWITGLGVWGLVLRVVAAGSEDGNPPRRYCVDMTDVVNFKLSGNKVLGCFIWGLWWIYAVWLGWRVQNERQAFWITFAPLAAALIVFALESTREIMLSYTCMGLLVLGWLVSLLVRRRQSVIQMHAQLSSDKTRYENAWAVHASDPGPILRLATACDSINSSIAANVCHFGRPRPWRTGAWSADPHATSLAIPSYKPRQVRNHACNHRSAHSTILALHLCHAAASVCPLLTVAATVVC